MRVVDSYGINGGATIFSVELAEDRFVDVKVCKDGGLVYVMQNEDGSSVYDGDWPYGTYPGLEYDENAVLRLVKEAHKVQAQAVVADVLCDAAVRACTAALPSKRDELIKG